MATEEQEQPPPTLYHVPRTISSPIYQLLLELHAVDCPVRVETLSFADLKTKEHLQRNPMGTSPTYCDGPLKIWESGAVLQYLLEQHDPFNKYHPARRTPKRAVYLHIQQYILATVYPFVATLYLHTLRPKDQQDAEYVKSATHKWKTLLAPTLESFVEGPFFLGRLVMAIDFLVAKPLTNAESMGLLREFPKLYKIYQCIESLPSYSVAYRAPPSVTDCAECRSLLLLPNKD